jgi:hypothetical protein
MDHPDMTVLLAVGVLITAAAVALVADQPSRPRHYWWHPVLVLATAALNIGLTMVVMIRPQPLTGSIVLGSALLLVYATHRHTRMVGIRHHHAGEGRRVPRRHRPLGLVHGPRPGPQVPRPVRLHPRRHGHRRRPQRRADAAHERDHANGGCKPAAANCWTGP